MMPHALLLNALLHACFTVGGATGQHITVLTGDQTPALTDRVDGCFHDRLFSSPVRERDPGRSNLFYLPLAPKGYYEFLSKIPGKKHLSHEEKFRVVEEYARHVVATARNTSAAEAAHRAGAPHFWVNSHDDGRGALTRAVGPWLADAIFVGNEGDPTSHGADPAKQEAFRPSRDVVSAPGAAVVAAWRRAWHLGERPPATRSTLVFYAGTNSTKLRQRMFGMGSEWAAAASRLGLRAQLVAHHLNSSEYEASLSSSLFCLCPRGFGVWSPRLVDAVMHGCIPAVLADTYWLPLSCFLDWRRFSLFLPEGDPEAWTALLTAALPRAAAMHAELLRVRRHLIFWSHQAENKYLASQDDHFEMLLLELYLRAHGCAAPPQRSNESLPDTQTPRQTDGSRSLS